MIGGGSADTYSVGLNEGSDVIDDRGGGGTDVLRLYTGQLATAFNYNWFKVDGSDLLVQIPNSLGGGYAINIRIKNMGSSAGGIERVQIYGGEGRDQTAPAWNLTALWEEKTRSAPPNEPVPGGPDPTDPGDTPEPDNPPSSLFTWIGTSASNTFVGGSGKDVAAGLAGADSIRGEGGDDQLMGNGGPDTLNGGSGDDLLIDDDPGSFYADNLVGGTGNDTLVFYGAPSDLTDTGDGGTGRDMAYIDLSDSTREWRLTDNDGDIWIRLDSGSSRGDIKLENFEALAVFFGSDDDFAHSGNQQAYFEGGGGNDQLISEGRNDYLDGGPGDDKLDAGTGVDWIDGGSGNDRAEVDLSRETRNLTYVADYAEDDDGFTFENGTHIRNVERIELVTGSGDDRIWLGDDDDDVDTRGGDDVIFTDLEAHDSVDGGSGWDRLVVDRSDSDKRLRSSYDSSDNDFEISLEDSYASAEHRLHASSIEELVLLGGSANDTLRGGSGDDELIGNGGDDSIRGGDGADRMEGGSGDDDIHIDEGADWADGGPGDDWADLDKSDSNVSFTFDTRFAATSGGTTLQDGTHIRNIERFDIDFGAGNDTVITTVHTDRNIDLGGGDNRIVIDHRGQTSTLIAGPGLRINLPSYLVSLDVPFDSASDRIWVRGADHASIYGGRGDDLITGLNGNDILDGGDGNDRLSGGLGQNFLTGGAGNDSFFVSSTDTIIELEGGGIDRVYATVNYILGAGVYVETLSTADDSGTDPLTLAGNEFDNRIFGNAGANLLYGMGGADFLAGLAGDDRYVVDTGGDLVVERVGEGYDTVFSPVSYALAATSEVEALSVLDRAGTQAIDLTGNEFANALYGNEGANRLAGGGGDDFLYGEGGDDRLEGGDGIDWAVYSSAAAGVTVSLALLGTAQNTGGGGVDTLVGIEGLMGSAHADTLIGNGSDNFLHGLGGADTMRGGAGNDTYYVDDVGDVVDELAGEGFDTVCTSLAVYSLVGTQIERLGSSADVAHDFRGNSGDNVVSGGGGNDVLRLQDGGTDIADGGAGNDVLYFGSSFAGADRADGGSGRDVLVLQGSQTLFFGANSLAGIESVSVQSGANAKFGDTANNFYDYKIVMADANTPVGVQLIVNGQSLRAGEDFTFDGSAESNGSFLVYGGHGVDLLTGGAGNDVFFFEGERWGASDKVDGGAGRDALIISAGSEVAHITFGAASLTGIEAISLNARYASDPSQKPSYDLVLANGNVAAGATLIVNGSSIADSGQFVGIDGRAVVGGNLILFGGAGNDNLKGGGGADLILGGLGSDSLTGGGGADVFRYDSTAESNAGATDVIGDFAAGLDKVDLGRIDSNSLVAGDQAFQWIGSSAFSGVAGQLRVYQSGGYQWVAGDTDGDGAADLLIAFQAGTAALGQGDFLL
jgi:Ca2+-binding RTX toxin-like protein